MRSMKALVKTKTVPKSKRVAGLKPQLPGEQGYILLAVMLLITVMLIALVVEMPRISQQIKREREEELIHRGKEYAIAIKKFYHKTGTYPVSLDQLESTNNLRFLRKRFKDPLTESGEWKLIHVGEAQIKISTNVGGVQGAAPGQAGTLNTSPPGNATPSPSPGGLGSSGGVTGGFNPGGGGLNPGGLPTSSPPSGTGGQLGTLNTQNIGTGLTGSQGGGPIIGVASTSKKTSIKEFNENDEYDQWLFVYDPRLEQMPGGSGVTIASPTGANAPPGSVPAGVVKGVTATQPGQTSPPSGPTPTPSPGPMATPTPQSTPH
jgi:type II secretory pathway pseudopilin PulG